METIVHEVKILNEKILELETKINIPKGGFRSSLDNYNDSTESKSKKFLAELIKKKNLLMEKINLDNDSKELEYIPESYKHISNRVYLCHHLGIIPKLSEHFKHDDNKLLIEFLKDLGIFKKSDKHSTINRAIKEIRANQNKLSSDNFRAILKEYPKLDSNLLK